MGLERRMPMLAAGSFGIAVTTYYFFGVWLLAQVGKNHPIDFVAVILILMVLGVNLLYTPSTYSGRCAAKFELRHYVYPCFEALYNIIE
jgi:hypothetical protein